MALGRDLGADRVRGLRRATGAALCIAAIMLPSAAMAYVGDSFLNIPGEHGHWKGSQYKGWMRAETSDWTGRLRRLSSGSADPLAGDKLFFGGPNAPRSGNSGKLVLALRKGTPDEKRLMRLCAAKTAIPQANYAESSDEARPVMELGPRPKEFPEFWEYKLSDLQIAECPVAEGAELQGFVLVFKKIEWLNYDPMRPLGNKVVIAPADLPNVPIALPGGGKAVQSYLITWIAPATTTTDAQCPVLSSKPGEAEVYQYWPKADIDAARIKNGEKGLSAGQDTESRGPGKLNAVILPGLVPDPGLPQPQTDVAEGIDLDGNDGRGAAPAGVRKHGNFTSSDGRTGIDNQLFRVTGCIPGFRGKRGYRNQTSNARRADGNVTTLVEISDIDDPKNDPDVEVAIIYAMDKPMRDNAGKVFIPNYTFRPTDNPNFALYNMRVHGRIVNGVVTTDVMPRFLANLGQDPQLTLINAQLRLQPQPDGSMKGYLGGYQRWRHMMSGFASGYSEGLFGYQTPAIYYALERNADGLRNPQTGEYDGISMAFEIDTVPAFITPRADQAANASTDVSNSK